MASERTATKVTEKPKFLAQVRQAAIISELNRAGSVTVSDLAQQLAVSEMTVRRDLVELEKDARLIRTHGGAVKPDRAPPIATTDNFDGEEPAFEARLARNATLKRRIAATAAELAGGARSIALDVGTTTYFLAEALTPRPQAKIFTNSIRSAGLLSGRGIETYLAGGRIRSEEMSTSGPSAVSQFETLWFDIAFVGISGLTADGIYDYSFEETDMKRVYLTRTSRRVVLCDSTKFNRMSLVLVGGLPDFNTLVCDEAPAGDLQAALKRAGVEIVVAR
ncbi:DeoR family transcriptional regulator [Xaviernesmea oryzae]|uniref:DeoR family transcriptional regulator n=1 Tax=Xaviernesmea oryzae TaxID=464029 RepID=A0A1Q9B0X1_9HYPH|nr:DeoR/GlpR family DNA-binding transcription regulator [Xaviernesmea oryzae]OLP61625.1 DeoR family transcriptional regulator [Xaviernesmea oryzae]SEL05759.1 transcriptional regulator, DeoR family [Xaviernesmea oryzae]